MGLATIDKTDFHFPGQLDVYRGKVRDVYDMGDSLLFIASDRYSAFDRNLALVPHKGELVTIISRWWFEQTKDIIDNHVIAYPDPNVIHAHKYKVVPIEMIVRGYITGITQTSLWHNYSQGQRDFGNFILPDGLTKNQKLPAPVVTPTTKLEAHDRPLTPEQAVQEGLIDAEVWDKLQTYALALFERGQKVASQKGLILVDTKYEFGLDNSGKVVLIDEIHTPDSSRYWRADSYKQSLNNGSEPDNYDKEFLRLWFKDQADPYGEQALPEAPVEVINELTNRYIYVYEVLSGEKFVKSDSSGAIDRIEANVTNYLKEQK